MKFALSKEEFEIFKKFVLGFAHIKNLNTDNSIFTFYVDDDDKEDFMTDMTFDIIDFGMDNQDTVNELGKKMYNIFDNLMYSKKGSKYRPE